MFGKGKGILSLVKNVQVGKSHTTSGENFGRRKGISYLVKNSARGKVILPAVKAILSLVKIMEEEKLYYLRWKCSEEEKLDYLR